MSLSSKGKQQQQNRLSQQSTQLAPRKQHRKHRGGDNDDEEDAAATAQAAALLAQQNEALKELEDHKKRLQIYVFVCRCIAYSFIAKQPTDMVRRQLKISKQQLQHIKDNFEAFLQNKMTNIKYIIQITIKILF